jgi:hypothetical protein
VAAVRRPRRTQPHHGDTRVRLHGRRGRHEPVPLRSSLRPGRPATHHRSRTRVRHHGRRGHGVVADPARAADRAGPHGCRRRADGLYRDDLPHRAVSDRPPRAAALARASDRRLGGQPRRAVYRAAGGRRSTALGRTPFHHLLPRVHRADGHWRNLGQPQPGNGRPRAAHIHQCTEVCATARTDHRFRRRSSGGVLLIRDLRAVLLRWARSSFTTSCTKALPSSGE